MTNNKIAQDIRGRKEPLTKAEKEFWERFSELCIDDPEDGLNELVGLLRETAKAYFSEISVGGG